MLRTYTCPKCGVFEIYTKEVDILWTCPDCSSPIKQRFGGNFRLIGPGFYKTDNMRSTGDDGTAEGVG